MTRVWFSAGAVAAGLLGAVESRLGISDQNVGVRSIGREQALADAGRDQDLVIVDPNNDTDPQGDMIGLDYDRDFGARVGLGRRTRVPGRVRWGDGGV